MDGRKGLVLALTAAACLGAVAATNTWVKGATGGWNDPNSWVGGVPGAGSVVAVPEGATMPVGEADMAIATTVAEIYLAESNSVVQFDFEQTYTMTGLVRGNGKIVKNGGGTLKLSNTTVDGYYAKKGMDVNKGVVHCPDTFPGTSNSTDMHIGPLYVAEGAIFEPYAKFRITHVAKLTGGGKIQNTPNGGYWPLRIATGEPCTFSGEIAGYIRLYVCGPIDLTGTKNSFMGECSFYSGSPDLGVMKFGSGSENETSIGRMIQSSARRPLIFNTSGRVRYLGTGERSDRDFKFGLYGVTATFDAGATGNLWMYGRFYASTANQGVLVLDGSNTVESTLACAWDEYGDNSTYIAKKGRGTWKLVGTSNRFNKGVVAVEEGTLKFDSLAETNIPCSFGLSTRLAQKYAGAWNESKKADYAILLGSTDTAGTLEWCGTNLWDNAVSTRPIAVTGKGGRLVVDGPNCRIGWKGAFAADEGGGTLTLAGDASTNYLYNVYDGHGTMSLAKDGSGTWVLAGDQTFGGRLNVREGELVVSSTQGTEYKWFRYTVKHTQCPDDVSTVYNNGMMRIAELALYDSSGNRLNRSFADAGNKMIPDPGEASLWNNKGSSGQVAKLFDESYASGYYFAGWCGDSAPRTNNAASWIPIVVRLPASAAAVASYDVCAKEGHLNGWTPVTWTMEASADGLFWDLVHDVKSNTVEFASNSWMSDGVKFTANAKRTGFAFGLDYGKSLLAGAPDQLANATVSVAEGAVLRAEGVVTIKSLAVDANGAGTVDGFSIAADGMLTVEGIEKFDRAVEIPITLMNVAGVENFASWKVSACGKVYRQAAVEYSNGRLRAIPPGCVVVIR